MLHSHKEYTAGQECCTVNLSAGCEMVFKSAMGSRVTCHKLGGKGEAVNLLCLRVCTWERNPQKYYCKAPDFF